MGWILAVIFCILWLATILGGPPKDINIPPSPVAGMWRCILKNKKEYIVPGPTEADAMKILLHEKVNPAHIISLEPMA